MLHNILIERKVYASEEHKMMQGMIQEFISNEILDQVDEWEKNGMVSREIWTRAGELGLLCMDMPEMYGGGGLDFTFNSLFIEALAKNDWIAIERKPRGTRNCYIVQHDRLAALGDAYSGMIAGFSPMPANLEAEPA